MKEATPDNTPPRALLKEPVNFLQFIKLMNDNLQKIPLQERKKATILAVITEDGNDVKFKIEWK